MADDDVTSGTTKTLTQADIDRAFAAGASREREKLAAKYGDYDELKAKAAEADKSKSQLDRIEEKLAATEKRAAEAERQGLIREVADELGISVKLASKLSGTTKTELLADGKETMDDLGIKPKSGTATKTTTTEGEGTEGEGGEGTEGEGGEGTEGDGEQQATSRQTAATRTARPRENLRSGATRTPTAPEVTNPMELVKNIPRY